MKITRPLLAAAFVLLSACNPPKFARYSSMAKDWSVNVPWGWTVMTDQQDDSFTQANFIGPFDGAFFLGAPSVSVRWYKRYRPHRLTDGRLELYTGVDDFVKQMLDGVYGPIYFLQDGAGKQMDAPYELKLRDSGLPAKFFTVLSPTPAPANNMWGITLQAGTNKPFVFRRHSYAIVTTPSGFYVLTYPATNDGYENHLSAYKELIGSFIPVTDGPGGAKFKIPGPGR
jgi:hypothetical protein